MKDKQQIIDKFIERIKIDYPEDDKLMMDLLQFESELQALEQPQEQEETILVDDNSIMGQTMKRSDYEAQFKQSQAQRNEELEDYIDHFRYKRDNDEPAKEQNETN